MAGPGRALTSLQGVWTGEDRVAEAATCGGCGIWRVSILSTDPGRGQLKIPSVIHDQNAVMGRANRMLAKHATRVASSFPELANLPAHARSKLVITGNPVRDVVLKERQHPIRAPNAAETFRLLVFGGSQGARFFAEFMPDVMKELPEAVRRNIHVTQQCRAEDLDRVKTAFAQLGFAHELQPFFMDMPNRIASSHLVFCRSGASTIAELGVIGRPAIMVPLPHALDNDQLSNAESFANAGAGWIRQQGNLTAPDLAAFLTRLRYQETELNAAAAAALGHGKPDAARAPGGSGGKYCCASGSNGGLKKD